MSNTNDEAQLNENDADQYDSNLYKPLHNLPKIF
jgi:hypothetical protein